MTPKQKSALLRRVARGADRILHHVASAAPNHQRDAEWEAEDVVGQGYFTCNAVRNAEQRAVGSVYLYEPICDAYFFTFFRRKSEGRREGPLEDALWDLPLVERNEVRVLMLCFAAAMAETGDL